MSLTNDLPVSKPLIALLTDFGTADHYAGVLKGVIASIAPKAVVIDLSHGVPPHDVRDASYLLWASYRFFPSHSIFLSVVDPGVGSDRKILVARTEKYLFVAPDNGLLDYVFSEERILECHEIRTQDSPYVLVHGSSTFQGRDVMAPVAAYLANGVDCGQFGPAAAVEKRDSPFVVSEKVDAGFVVHCDRFGNVLTNIRNNLFDSLKSVRVKRTRVARKIRFYGEGKANALNLIRGSSDLVEIVIKEGDAARRIGAKAGTTFRIEWR